MGRMSPMSPMAGQFQRETSDLLDVGRWTLDVRCWMFDVGRSNFFTSHTPTHSSPPLLLPIFYLNIFYLSSQHRKLARRKLFNPL